MNTKYIFGVFLCLIIGTITQAQTIIKNQLIDAETNAFIADAYIQEQGKNNLVYSNEEGRFEITVESTSSILVISHVTYKTLEVSVGNLSKKIIALKSLPMQVDDVLIKREALPNISNTEIISDELKNGSQIRNAGELFNDIPGFSIQKRSATAQEPSFRSFKYEQMNLKYDGGNKVVHACPNRMDPITAHIIPEEVKKIEIIKGPYTVRFGQRFGATVNLVTKAATPEKHGFSGTLESGYETNGNNAIGRVEVQYAHKIFDVAVNGETRNFGDYKDGNKKITPAGFSTNSYSVKTGFNLSKKQRLVIDWRQKFGSNIKHAGLAMDSPKDDSYVLGLDYKYNNISKKIESVSLKAYTSFVDHIMNNFDRPNFENMAMESPVKSRTLGGRFEMVLAPAKKLKLYTGLDADLIDRSGIKNTTMKKDMMGNPIMMPMTMRSEIWQDAVIQDYGMFLEGNYAITKYISTIIGVRGDFVTASIRNPEKSFSTLYGGKVENQFDFTLGANASALYRKKGWQVELAYGRGTRTPSMVERFINKFTIGIDSYNYIGNPNLKPEVNNQFELSFSKKLPKIHTGANAYYSIFENYITARLNPDFNYTAMGKTNTPKQFVNVAAEQFGFEAFFNYNFYKNLFFTSDIAYTSAYNKTFNEHLAQIAPLRINLGLKYDNKKYWGELRSEFVFDQNQVSQTFNETATPGYIILDLRAGFVPVKNLSIGGAVLNLLDKAYYNHLNFSYTNADLNAGEVFEAGRSFSIFAQYKF